MQTIWGPGSSNGYIRKAPKEATVSFYGPEGGIWLNGVVEGTWVENWNVEYSTVYKQENNPKKKIKGKAFYIVPNVLFMMNITSN